MKWSLKLGRVAGVDVFVHWTFVILIVWIFVAHLGASQNVAAALRGVGFVLALFACVMLHEFGHALTARRYGIRTRDITLLPIGGVARLERMPENPRQELWVALAGPAVNVVIAAVLFVSRVMLGGPPQEFELAGTLASGDFAARLMAVNLFLAVFNLLPAFPMDGGRVLRALLATRLGRRRATQIAANIGQGMAMLMGLLGLLTNPFLVFIAFFVYIGAQAEAQMVELTTLIRGLAVRDAMQTRFRTLAPDAPLSTAVAELLAGSQHDFPIVDGASVHGILRRQDLVKALSEKGSPSIVSAAMSRECAPVQASDSLEAALEKLKHQECSALPVLEDDRLVGMLTLENLSDLVMVNTALERRGNRRAEPTSGQSKG
ncbi:MAG: site-2 protease family protein [Opitutaceae bacterium]